MPDLSPVSPPVTPIADDLFQVRLPLPFALNHVNVYLLRGADGWTLFDTGLNTPAAQAVWLSALDALGLRPADISQIVLTHTHPDHYGMAGWWQAQTSAPVCLGAREAEWARLVWQRQGAMGYDFDGFLKRCGLPDAMIAGIMGALEGNREATFPHPTAVRLLEPGGTLRAGARVFQIMHAPGHSDGQLMFYDADDRLLLCGDHVLMKITPNIGLWPDSEPEPLARYLASLAALRALDVRLALPGHKTLITHWSARLDELLAHHAARLNHTLAAVAGGATVYEAAVKIFSGSLFSSHEWRFAAAEALAHLDHLQGQGQIRRADETGIWRFYAL